jgi:hypothetical protein
MMKPFLPQLQRTFCKALSETQSTSQLRSEAAYCLSLLLPLQTRFDPLVVELMQSLKSSGDKSIVISIWEALAGLMSGIGADRQISQASVESIKLALSETLLKSTENESPIRISASKCYGALMKYLPRESASDFLRYFLLMVELP